MNRSKPPKVLEVRPAGEDHQVVSLSGGAGRYRRSPCPGCPWVVANVGTFPTEAFRHSARTAVDMSQHVFACHESGAARPASCAGFLLRGAEHNLSVRLAQLQDRLDLSVVREDDRELFDSYRDMAVANGVGENEECLRQCR